MFVRAMRSEDVRHAAVIHQLSFDRQLMSDEWVKANLAAFPRVLCFVAGANEKISGYIIWTQKSGFRAQVVLELEQIAVHPELRSKGIGQMLIEESLLLVRRHLSDRNATLKHIIVTTRSDNKAQVLYKRAIGAEVEAVIKNLYSADEVIMVSREPNNRIHATCEDARA